MGGAVTMPTALAGPTLPAAAGAPDKLRTVAKEFESMVLTQLLAPMFEALDADGFGGGGSGERMFRPMLVERYADAMTGAGGIGVADAVLAELVRLQEAAHGAAG
jgi:Rod binding domain-containing protein